VVIDNLAECGSVDPGLSPGGIITLLPLSTRGYKWDSTTSIIMIPVKLGRTKYHIILESPGVIYDASHKRLSEAEIKADLKVSAEAAWNILRRIYEADHPPEKKTLDLPQVMGLCQDNLENVSAPGVAFSEAEIHTALKGINYGVIKRNDIEEILRMLTRVAERIKGGSWKKVTISYKGANRLALGRIRPFLAAPYGSVTSDHITTCPLLVPPVSSFLLKAQSQASRHGK